MAGFKFHVFLSHSGADKPAVEELAVRLRREGIEPWLDKWNLVPGDPWQPAIERALDDCAACAVVIGAGGVGAWQNEEMRAAITRRVVDGSERFRVIPVLLPGVDRPERGRLPSFLLATTWVEFRRSLEDAEAFHQLICGIQGREPGAGPGGVAFEGTCPYRGLEAFDVEHAPFFFGREALTEWLVDEVRPKATGQQNRFLAILGASGSGKSSLARAGLVAALNRGAIDGSGDWPIVLFKPGRDPIESLAVALASLPGGAALIRDARDILNIKALGDDPKSLHLFARLALRDAPGSHRLVVLVDQTEEVFTLCEDAAARRSFFDNLVYAATIAAGQTIVLLTMRDDFYGKCAPYPTLAAAMSDHHRLVGPMSGEELGRAIERPALLAGGEFEPGLAERLVRDVEGQPGSLPLLQFALMELWRRREGRRLTRAAYKEVGELRGALENRADEVLGEFDAAGREFCRRIFLRLTQPGAGTEDTRRRASFAELVPAGADPRAVEAVVRRLADARLITTEAGANATGEVSVEVAHEALVRGWGRLREWIGADRAGLAIHRQLTEAARDWAAHRREHSFLYGGSRLALAGDWAKAHPDDLNELEAEFLAASRRRQRMAKVVQVAPIVLMTTLVLGGWESYRSAKKQELDANTEAVNDALATAATESIDDHWQQAVDTLEKAEKKLGPGVEYQLLRDRVASALKSYRDKLVSDELDEAGFRGISNRKNEYDWKAVHDEYRRVFDKHGIDIDDRSKAVAKRIREENDEVRGAMAGALDVIARHARTAEEQSRWRDFADDADTDLRRLKIRRAERTGNVAALKDMADDPALLAESPATRECLWGALLSTGQVPEAIALMRGDRFLRPNDFSLNYFLGDALEGRMQYSEAIRFYTVAVASHPDSCSALVKLGETLGKLGKDSHKKEYIKEGLKYLDRAIELAPDYARAYRNHGYLDTLAHAYVAIEDFNSYADALKDYKSKR
jgi:tetratricopeptide (TPR) repeat protein